MATLYPPYIEGKLPAQYGDTLCIPFQYNRATGANLIGATELKYIIRSVTTNQLIKEGTDASIDEKNNATIKITGANFVIGQYYKIQFAWGNNPYSTVGVFKYTSEPEITIDDGEESGASFLSWSKNIYVGKFLTADLTERVEKYRFILFTDKEIVEDTGWMSHEASSDTVINKKLNSIDEFSMKYNFEDLTIYYIRYEVKTLNDIYISSRNYELTSSIINPITPKITGIVQSDFDRGVIKIGAQATSKESIDLIGYYHLLRLNNNKWERLTDIAIDIRLSPDEKVIFYEDYTVEQGINYTYAIQQYDENTVSTIFKLGGVTADFDSAFLCDGECSLKIEFNPKISSFKTTLLETKIDTLGSTYPLFFRNGHVKYKEFPISGLISKHMDKFNDFSDLEIEDTNLTPINIAKERVFKIDVLDWLNNGQPKVFKSPAEGNYIVRLMNVSLSPEDQLGRMLHTFSATAYEIAEYTYSNLEKYNLMNLETVEQVNNLKYNIETVASSVPRAIYLTNPLKVTIKGTPETPFVLAYEGEMSGKIFHIGRTGIYEVPMLKASPSIAVSIYQGTTVEYWYKQSNLEEYNMVDSNKIKNTKTIEQIRNNTTENRYYLRYLRISKADFPKEENEKVINGDTPIGDNDYQINGVTFTLGSNLIEYTYKDFPDPYISLQIGKNLVADIYHIKIEKKEG